MLAAGLRRASHRQRRGIGHESRRNIRQDRGRRARAQGTQARPSDRLAQPRLIDGNAPSPGAQRARALRIIPPHLQRSSSEGLIARRFSAPSSAESAARPLHAAKAVGDFWTRSGLSDAINSHLGFRGLHDDDALTARQQLARSPRPALPVSPKRWSSDRHHAATPLSPGWSS